MDNELKMGEKFTKCHMQPKNILDDLRENNKDYAVKYVTLQ